MSKWKQRGLCAITVAWLIMAWTIVASAGTTCSAELSFDDLPEGYFYTYGYDLSNDGTDDILFTTECGPGFRASTSGAVPCPPLVHPGLQGTTVTPTPEITVEFPGGATGRIAFDFAVPSPLSTPGSPEAYITLVSEDPYIFKSAPAQAYGRPAVGKLEVNIGFVAVMARIQFYAGSGASYIMDNFEVGIWPSPTLSGCPGDVDGDGDVDGSDLAALQVHADRTCLLEQWAEYSGTTDCLEE